MAGIEALAPSMSSDPDARMWQQIRALQLRVASLEARRDIVYRASATNYVPSGTDSIAFNAGGRSLLIQFGPSRLLLPAAAGGGAPRLGNAYVDLNFPTPVRISTVATSFDTNAAGAFQSTNVQSQIIRGVPPGAYTATIGQQGATELRYSILILELPN